MCRGQEEMIGSPASTSPEQPPSPKLKSRESWKGATMVAAAASLPTDVDKKKNAHDQEKPTTYDT